MKLTILQSPKSSRMGSLRLDGLLVNPLGEVEPILIIRASEAAAFMTAVAYLDQCKAKSYPLHYRDNVQIQTRKMQGWQRAQGVMNREVDEVVKSELFDGEETLAVAQPLSAQQLMEPLRNLTKHKPKKAKKA